MVDKTGYTITHAEVTVTGGVKVTANVSSPDGIKALLDDLRASGLASPTENAMPAPPAPPAPQPGPDSESPAERMETQAGLDVGRLAASKIVAIKDGVPQILQKSLFTTVTDAVLVLMYALEVGLRQNPVSYEDFSALYESQNLKSGSPLSMLVTNLRNAGYLDNRVYADGRRLRLTAKGERKAIEVLKRLASRSA